MTNKLTHTLLKCIIAALLTCLTTQCLHKLQLVASPCTYSGFYTSLDTTRVSVFCSLMPRSWSCKLIFLHFRWKEWEGEEKDILTVSPQLSNCTVTGTHYGRVHGERNFRLHTLMRYVFQRMRSRMILKALSITTVWQLFRIIQITASHFSPEWVQVTEVKSLVAGLFV